MRNTHSTIVLIRAEHFDSLMLNGWLKLGAIASLMLSLGDKTLM